MQMIESIIVPLRVAVIKPIVLVWSVMLLYLVEIGLCYGDLSRSVTIFIFMFAKCRYSEPQNTCSYWTYQQSWTRW